MKTNTRVTALRLGSAYYQTHKDCEEQKKETVFTEVEKEQLKGDILEYMLTIHNTRFEG